MSNEIDVAIVKQQLEDIRDDVKTIINSLGSVDQRYHALSLSVEKAIPTIQDNKKRLDKLEPVVLIVMTIPVVLGGLWAIVSAVMQVLDSF